MKQATTQELLEAALSRVVSGNTLVVPANARINVSNVEKESGLGNGSAYHYPEMIEKIKSAAASRTGKPPASKSRSADTDNLKAMLIEERRLKEKYRAEAEEWKARAESLAAQLYEMQEIQKGL
jgi:hypothetical protein